MFRTPDSCSEPGTASTSKIRPADLGLVDQANRTRARGFKLGFPNDPVPVPVHFLDSKALSSLGLFYFVYMLSREPTHKFHPPILGNERPLSLWKAVMAPSSVLGFQACPRRRERGCRGGSADLVPTSRPLRSEQALGSVVPSPILLPDLPSH